MHTVMVAGAGMTRFEKSPRSLRALAGDAVRDALVGRPGMNGRTYAQPIDGRKVFGAKGTLGIEDRRNRVFGARKGRAKRIANGFKNAPIVVRNRRAHQRVVPSHGVLHRRAVAVPAHGAAFDIAEQERHGARRRGYLRAAAGFLHGLLGDDCKRTGAVVVHRDAARES